MASLLALDTTLLIDHRRHHPDASPYVLDLLANGVAAVHPVCAAELLEGVIGKASMAASRQFLAAFRMLPVKPADFTTCLDLVADLRLAHGIGWADCLIAATCLRLDVPLVTINDRHFRRIRALRVVRPY
jgi:predicted nucleic acid-binding protein